MISYLKRILNITHSTDVVQTIVDREIGLDAIRNNPLARKVLIDCSKHEDDHNSQYNGMLNTLSNHCIGTIPLPVVLSDSDPLNDIVEDYWYEWGQYNNVGASLREARRKAAQTGIAVLIPYKSNSDYDLKLAYRVVGADSLQSPYHKPLDPLQGQIIDGVEFWPNGEIKRVWVLEEHKLDPTPYDVGDRRGPGAIVWYKRTRATPMIPECSPAFQIIPSMSRFMQNILREAEFKSAIPMAVKLDPDQYKSTSSAPPKGAFKYEPGMIPTLPPGTDLVGVAMQSMAEDRASLSDKFCAVAARCIDMPKNLAIMDSSNSNMATAHIDLQPWKYVVDIDRFDFECVVKRIYRQWYQMASLIQFYTPDVNPPPTLFNYTVLFNHPDPAKCATARSTDLISGASTLSIQYAEQSKNARREIAKDAKLFNITPEKYLELILAARSKQALELLNASKEDETEVESST